MRTHQEIRQAERKSLEKQLVAIIQNRRMKKGEYFEKVTPEYELALEYDDFTLFISLNVVGGKNFRQIVCDEGQYQLKNGLSAEDVFQTFSSIPDSCQIDPLRGVLTIKITIGRKSERTKKLQIKLQEKKLGIAIIQKIECGRVARKCLKYFTEDRENWMKKYEEQERKYLRQIEESKINLVKQERKYKKEIQELKKQMKKPIQQPIQQPVVGKKDPANLVMPTLSAKGFTINHNIITKSSDGDSNKMVLLDMVVGQGVFSFRTHIHNVKGRLQIGVTDRVTQKERDWAQKEFSIKYRSMLGYIFYPSGKGQYSREDGGISLKEGMDLLCQVEREKTLVTFTVFEGEVEKNKRQIRSPILRQSDRQFVPYFEMKTIGTRISWELL